MAAHPVIVWFRQDLRVDDNPALVAACETGRPILPVFIWAPEDEGKWSLGEASRWWLHHALASLREALATRGLGLLLRSGSTRETLDALLAETDANAVFWNRRYEPVVSQRDAALKKHLLAAGIDARSFNGSLLFEPHTVKNKSGGPFKVFTPFWKHLQTRDIPASIPLPEDRLPALTTPPKGEPLDALGLLPSVRWDTGMAAAWEPGLAGGHARLRQFSREIMSGYSDTRNLPAVDGTSRLSPYLHIGQISPRQIWTEARAASASDGGTWSFLREVAWREFAYHLLFHFPETPEAPLRPEFERFPWEPDEAFLAAWQTGQTGFPVVDAGMRQLWETGWMHNRVRMIVASLLVKHLLQPWPDGAAWFWDTLVDADLANNTLGWQWSAGCGADAAPYFRVFNPITQGEKFDESGHYVRRYVPELRRLPDVFLHQPWAAPPAVRERAGVDLGGNYPEPVIAHKAGRERALAAYETIKKGR